MCGFLFEYNINKGRTIFQKSLNDISHRGPDFTGTDITNKVKLGHQRLSILDLNPRSNQPFYDSSRRYAIVYNGEVFNFKDLIKEFNLKCDTNCDTEVILNLYIKIGPNFIEKLNGMFSFCIYDSLTDIVYVGRDRYGIKPMFYFQTESGFVISSEIKPLLNYTKSNDLDSFSIRQYKKMRGFKPGRTLFKEIKEFLPGHFSEGASIDPKKYWEASFGFEKKYDREEFSYLFNKSINDCTISDVSYDCMLSGGLDSSLIAALTNPKNCWVIGRTDDNEFEFADAVATKHSLKLNKVIFNPSQFVSELDKEIEKRSYPITVPNEILINVLSKDIVKSSKVVLCGEGADEVFLGYDRIFRHFQNKKINIEDFEKLYCYGKEKDFEVIEDCAGHIIGKGINELRKFFIEFHMLGLLKRVDFNTMRHSIESRVPFLHNELFDYASRLDSSVHIDLFDSKKILKNYCFDSKILPTNIINRKKVGFPVKFDFIVSKFGMEKISSYDDWFDYNINYIKKINK